MYKAKLFNSINSPNNGDPILKILVILYAMHKILPAVGFYMPAIVYFGIFAILLIYLLINRSPLKNYLTLFAIFSISFLKVFIYLFSWKVAAIPTYLYGEFQILLFGMISLYYLNLDLDCQKKIMKYILLMYLFTAVTTYIGCIRFPEAPRYLATLSQEMALYNTYVSSNIGGFTFIYELVLITPLFVYLTKSKKLNPIIGILIIAFIGVTFVKAQYTTALIMYILSLLVLCIPRINTKKIMIIVAVALVLIIANISFFAEFFDKLSTSVESDVFSTRFEYISDALGGEASDVEGTGDRISLYKKSWNAFVNSWFMGDWSTRGSAGGHSFFFDTLAVYGLAGFVCMIIMYTLIYQQFIRPYKDSDAYPYCLWSFMVGIILAVINPKTYMFILIFVLPLFGNISLCTKRSVYDEHLMDSK